MTEFKLLMISAMYENGGNVTHRLLDGHPELNVYPFESQLGTSLSGGALAGLYPKKYRWPVFPLSGSPEADYRLIIDEECRVRARTPHVSKFRHIDFDFDDDERGRYYVRHIDELGRSRSANVEAFFRATFDAWRNCVGEGRAEVFVGYSPIVGVDFLPMLSDLPEAHLLHVVRNPWSAYADTKKRPVPLPLETYMLGWATAQHAATAARGRFPDRVHVLRLEDILEDPPSALSPIVGGFGLGSEVDSLSRPTWNGEDLQEVYPWGTIRRADPWSNVATARELDAVEIERVRLHAGPYLETFGYGDLLA